jgi:phosphohistidine phosphatase
MSDAKRLYVLRHAKSSWDDPVLPDHERPLSRRGQKAVALLAEHVQGIGLEPAVILCSPARRTRETLAGVLPGHDALIEPELYGASANDLLNRLTRLPAGTESVMIVGHNPSVQSLVLKLAGPAAPPARNGEDESPLQMIERKFPTAALATLAILGEWAQLRPGAAALLDYVRPKALA